MRSDTDYRTYYIKYRATLTQKRKLLENSHKKEPMSTAISTTPLPPVNPSLDEAVTLIAKALAAGNVNDEKVRQIVREEIGTPRKISISLNKAPAYEVSGCHPMMPKVLALASAGINVLMVGPAGAGKTHIAHDVANAVGRPFGSISLSAGITESHLTGRLLPVGEGGRFGYIPSPFVQAYENGGVYLFDELDAADPNVLLVVNAAMANGGFDVEARVAGGLPSRVNKHPDCLMLGAANTYGTGADMQYAGRNVLDAATLDRWYVVNIGYHTEYEGSLAGVIPDNSIRMWEPSKASHAQIEERAQKLVTWVWGLRTRVEEKKIRRIISTRMCEKAIKALTAGLTVREISVDLLSGWTPEEKSAVGISA